MARTLIWKSRAHYDIDGIEMHQDLLPFESFSRSISLINRTTSAL